MVAMVAMVAMAASSLLLFSRPAASSGRPDCRCGKSVANAGQQNLYCQFTEIQQIANLLRKVRKG